MQELINQMTALVQGAGGSMPYAALLEAVGFENRSKLPKAMKFAEASGVLKRHVAFDAESGQVVFTIQATGE